MKTCEICKASKPLSDFSKSYKNRCKACVAELAREKRARKNHNTMDAVKLTKEALASLVKATEGLLIGVRSGVVCGLSDPCECQICEAERAIEKVKEIIKN